MPLPDCPHDSGFRNPVRLADGTVEGICLDCGRWFVIRRDGEVGEDAGEHDRNVSEHDVTVTPHVAEVPHTSEGNGAL